MRYILITATLILIGSTHTNAQWYFNGREWQWHGNRQPTFRPYDQYQSGPRYPFSANDPRLYQEFRNWGGRPVLMCPSPRGPIPCY